MAEEAPAPAGGLLRKRASAGLIDQSAASVVAGGAARVTVVADREGDIYEEFAWALEAELVIRAAQDRALEDGATLLHCMGESPELGREIIGLPANPGRPARQAVLSLSLERSRL